MIRTQLDCRRLQVGKSLITDGFLISAIELSDATNIKVRHIHDNDFKNYGTM